MSLYYEAADLIKTLGSSQDASLKSLLFRKTQTKADQPRKSNPAQLYALITESWKWSSILRDVIEQAGLLSLEKKLSPQLALVLVHDLLLARKGIAAPESHVLRKAVERHKTRLKAEFTKARIRSGCPSIDELRLKLAEQNYGNSSELVSNDEPQTGDVAMKWPHPRWLRVNTLRTTQATLLKAEFSEWEQVSSLAQIFTPSSSATIKSKIYHVDDHVLNLLALPPNTELASIPAYKRGELISQDKASCFPAYLLSSGVDFTGWVLDACAAPGNKTSHIAAIISEQAQRRALERRHDDVRVYATERDPYRAEILSKLLELANANHVHVKPGQDFLQLDPTSQPWSEVSAIILDPSCSGSGIVDRGQTMTFDLPSVAGSTICAKTITNSSKKNKKRKHGGPSHEANSLPAQSDASTNLYIGENENDATMSGGNQDASALQARLVALAALQTKMLTFAMSFPKVERITYSTCSVHDTENENVIIAALASETAKNGGWRLLKREEQVEGLKRWAGRGSLQACLVAAERSGITGAANLREIADACIRCEPFTKEGTQGFFVAGFVRVLHGQDDQADYLFGDISSSEATKDESEEGEWGGFDD